ncbi:hypothetical protein [Streptomyces sp. NPDC004435]|uniref:hypothetical protein n=1 Tax=Streptomyces sp. NPDC004435 TaxID=3364701 RepID=UPI0036992C1B
MLSESKLSYCIVKMPPARRRAMLAAIDIGGHLPTNTPGRVLDSIPETWARTDTRTGLRWLTEAGASALLNVDRFRKLRRADPEKGIVTGLSYAEGRGLTRDGLIVFLDPRGRPADPTDRWITGAVPYITPRGRKVVGMPLAAPALTARFPLWSWAIWRRPGQPDVHVQVHSWPMLDGKVRVWLPKEHWNRPEREVPVTELRPLPRRVRVLPRPAPASGPVRSARARLARIQRAPFRRVGRSGHP